MGGYPCGGPGEPCGSENRPYFRPYNSATRGQLSKIVSNAAGFSETPVGQLFADVAPDAVFYEWIQRLASRSIIGGYPCGGAGEPCDSQNRPYFRTGNTVTRGQVAKIAAGAFYPNCQSPQPTPPPGSTAVPTVALATATPACVTGIHASSDVPRPIPDLGTATSTLNVSRPGQIQDLDLTGLNISHTWIGDLRVSLTSPAGTTVVLIDQVCNNGRYGNFNNISLDDSASQSIGAVCPPATGSAYRPDNPLSAFTGQSANGTWTLTVEDLQAGDSGTLNAWGLRITTCP